MALSHSPTAVEGNENDNVAGLDEPPPLPPPMAAKPITAAATPIPEGAATPTLAMLVFGINILGLKELYGNSNVIGMLIHHVLLLTESKYAVTKIIIHN